MTVEWFEPTRNEVDTLRKICNDMTNLVSETQFALEMTTEEGTASKLPSVALARMDELHKLRKRKALWIKDKRHAKWKKKSP